MCPVPGLFLTTQLIVKDRSWRGDGVGRKAQKSWRGQGGAVTSLLALTRPTPPLTCAHRPHSQELVPERRCGRGPHPAQSPQMAGLPSGQWRGQSPWRCPLLRSLKPSSSSTRVPGSPEPSPSWREAWPQPSSLLAPPGALGSNLNRSPSYFDGGSIPSVLVGHFALSKSPRHCARYPCPVLAGEVEADMGQFPLFLSRVLAWTCFASHK